MEGESILAFVASRALLIKPAILPMLSSCVHSPVIRGRVNFACISRGQCIYSSCKAHFALLTSKQRDIAATNEQFDGVKPPHLLWTLGGSCTC